MRIIIISLMLFGMIMLGLGSLWFNRNHVGMMIERVPNVVEFRARWQALLDSQTLRHPAVIHWLPEGCLCAVLTSNHAANVTVDAEKSGFNVYQLASSRDGLLGQSLLVDQLPHSPIGSLIAITNKAGQLAYLGAYSDGVRCNTGNSMVAEFISSTSNLPFPPVVSLDVETCVC